MALEALMALSRSMSDENSSITAWFLMLRANSALNCSPADKTWKGFIHDGMLLNPTEDKRSMASSGELQI